jgi:hypothetical protein
VADRLRPQLTKLAVSCEGGDCVLGEGGTSFAYATLPAGHRGKLRCADIFFVRAGLDHGFLYRAGSLIKVNFNSLTDKPSSVRPVVSRWLASKPLRRRSFSGRRRKTPGSTSWCLAKIYIISSLIYWLQFLNCNYLRLWVV